MCYSATSICFGNFGGFGYGYGAPFGGFCCPPPVFRPPVFYGGCYPYSRRSYAAFGGAFAGAMVGTTLGALLGGLLSKKA